MLNPNLDFNTAIFCCLLSLLSQRGRDTKSCWVCYKVAQCYLIFFWRWGLLMVYWCLSVLHVLIDVVSCCAPCFYMLFEPVQIHIKSYRDLTSTYVCSFQCLFCLAPVDLDTMFLRPSRTVHWVSLANNLVKNLPKAEQKSCRRLFGHNSTCWRRISMKLQPSQVGGRGSARRPLQLPVALYL